jgi:hypothetical protein
MVQGVYLWRLCRSHLTPWPLFAVTCFTLLLHLVTTLIALDYWWVAFWTNRLFELALLYIAGCASFRMFRLRHTKRGAPPARPSALFEALQAA